MVNFSFSANKKIIFGTDKSSELLTLLSMEDGMILFLTGHSVRETSYFETLSTALGEKRFNIEFVRVSGEPSPETINSIISTYRDMSVSCVVALGGGSVLDAGKAVSAMLCEEGNIEDYLEGVGCKTPSGKKVPFIALPTTAGTGSECTKNAAISRPGPQGFKKSLRHDNYIPDIAIIDPRWTEFLPSRISASCGMDAFSQLLESYLSTGASTLTDSLARTGLENFFSSFSCLLEGNASDKDRGNISLGAAISGLTLANAGLGTVHGIAGVLGGLYPIPHGSACGILMPSVMRQTLSALLDRNPIHPSLLKAADLGKFLRGNSELSTEDAVLTLVSQLDLWADQASLPSLKEYGIKEKDLKKAAELSGNKNNPYSFSNSEILEILENCY